MKKEEQSVKLKPVLFYNGRYNYNSSNRFKQDLLLKAMEITGDPEKMRQMAGIKTVTEFYREMDKLHIRRDYHSAMGRWGITPDYIVQKIKDIIEDIYNKPAIKLRALEMFLKSVGLDTYKSDVSDSGNSWEDLIADDNVRDNINNDEKVADYEVIVPEIPKEELERMELEKEIGKGMYD